VCLENTHNRCGGAALSVEYTAAVGRLADERGLRLHIDGARIFNAAVAQGVEARDLAAPADSITFCLSKGLCAPVGSVLCGPADFIREARRTRKVLGGGMRQAGVIAAAGIVALETMVDRLAEDHANARRLAEGLANLPGVEIELERVQTNLVFFGLRPEVHMDAKEVAAQLAERGVKVGVAGPRRFRAVTHYWIRPEDVDTAVGAFSAVLRSAV
jgi:threonine aldolase